MALWNKVVSGFDREEETVNFGARAVAENNGSLYETSTIATIQSDGKATNEPAVQSSVQSTRFSVAIDKSITIFENEMCEEILLSIGFGSLINCYCISRNGQFLFVVLATGVLYCLHLPTNGKLIYTKTITNDKINIVKVFVQEDQNEYAHIYLISRHGAIFRVSSFKMKLIECAIMDENEAALKEVVKDIQCDQLFKGFSYDEVIHVGLGNVNGETTIAMSCQDSLFMWPGQQCLYFKNLSYNYTKVELLKNCVSMLGLRTDHLLNVLCPHTLLGYKIYHKPVSDFTVIENNENLCEIIILEEHEENHFMHSLSVFSFPGLEKKFQINVSTMTYLVDVVDSCDENLLFLEGVNENGMEDKYIDTIRIKTISESIPEYQLQRLLRRGQFGAAEEFAVKYNLSVESIYCAKAALFMSQHGPWSKKCSEANQLEELISILDKIQNVQFVVECCSKTLLSQYKQMRKLHLYARSRIIENVEKLEDTQHLNLLHTINDTLNKLETFHMIWGCQLSTDYYDQDTMQEWIRFSRASFMEEYKTHLSLGEVEPAALIWARHISGMIDKLSMKTIQDIFEILPEELSPTALWPWFSHFIPTLLSVNPDAINEIISWAVRKVKSLEQSHRALWPRIGIDFANRFIKLLKFEDNHQSLYFHQEYASQNSALKQFVLLMQALSDIEKLKINYRLAIPLHTYIGKSTEVSQILLDKIHVNTIPEFVNIFLKQYMFNHSLKNDDICSSYIQKTIRNSKSWWSMEEAPWEKRTVAVINLIHDIENKLQRTLEVLRKAPVPWSPTMLSLAQTSMAYDHALSSKIRTEYNYVPIKLVLKKYGYECIGINNDLISRIIKENHKDMIAHISELTKNDQASRGRSFAACISYYLSKGNINRVSEILNSLEDDILLYCCEDIVNNVLSRLPFKVISKSVVYYIEMFGWIKSRLSHIAESCNGLIVTIDEVRSLYFLRNEFQINITLTEYQTKKKQIFQNYIQQMYSGNIAEDDKLSVFYEEVLKVANLLKIERYYATSVLVETAQNADVLKYFTRHEGCHLNLTTEEAEHISKIGLLTIQHTEMDAEVATIVENLSASALRTCSESIIYGTLLSNASAKQYRSLLCKHSTNAIESKQEEARNVKWKLYPIYKDLSISADTLILPIFKGVITIQIMYIDILKQGEQIEPLEPTDQLQTQSNLENLLNDLLHKIKQLKLEHNDYCLLQIIRTLYFTCCSIPDINQTSLIDSRSFFMRFIMRLLRKLISARTFDLQLGLSCLFMLPQSEACKWISAACKSFQVDYARHIHVSVLGYEYFRLIKNESLTLSYKSQKALHGWAQRLSKYSISYKEILTSDATTKREILQRVMSCSTSNTVPLLEDFCYSFGFNISDCLLVYLETLIKNWNPKLNVLTCNGKKELHINEEEVNSLKEECNIIVAKLPDKIDLKNCVTTLWSQINFYYYEVFIILMDIVEDKNIEHRNYFCFLQNYTRSGQPTEIERYEWMNVNPGQASLPPISEWRLPFLPKVELWKLITPELNLKTYEKWLDIAPILKLQPHIICTLAIKGEVTRAWQHVDTKSTVDNWALSSTHTSLLNDIKKCIKRMTGPDALYYGTVALYYVVNHTPPGADQVAAAYECYTYAQLSAKESTTLEEGMLEKIKFKYLRFTSEHVLRTHGLGTKNYLALTGNPYKLVRDLYLDESIPQRYRSVIDHRPDVNSAVDALGKLFSINLIKLRLELLHEWLQPDHRYMKLDQSMTETFSVLPNSEPSKNYDDNLLRACYILEHGDIELSSNFLINIGFGDDNDDYGPEVKYRALNVLQTITDPATLVEITKRDIPTIRQYVKSLKYISKLESLGLGYSISTFEACSKQDLVRILMETQNYSVQAITLIAQLCIDYEIYEYSLWDKLLSRMAKLLMVNELRKVLLQVRNLSVIVNCNGYLSGWQVLVSEPFGKMDNDPNLEQIDHCIEVLRLLHSCPVVHILHFTDIINYCVQCKQLHLAAALLPFFNDADREYTIEVIKKSVNPMKVLEDLTNLSACGVLSIAHCCMVIQSALAEE